MENIKHNESLREINNIIQDKFFNILFQPVVSLKNGEILGYQVLGRGPENTQFYDTEILYNTARKYNLTLEVKLACRLKAAEKIREKLIRPNIFMDLPIDIIGKVKDNLLLNSEQLLKHNIYPNELVFEVTESTSVKDYRELKNLYTYHIQNSYMEALRATNCKNENNILPQSYPYVIKIGEGLIKDIDSNKYRQEFVKMVKEIGDMDGIKIIAEGIDTENQLRELIRLGIEYGCGDIIQSPVEEIKQISNDKIKLIKDINSEYDKLKINGIDGYYVGLLAEKERPVSLETSIDEVNEIFSQHYYLQGIPIVKNDIPVGIVMRNKFYFQLLRKKTDDLNLEPIKTMMTRLPLIVDYYAPLNKVIKLATGRRKECIYDFIIVSQNGKYYGIVSVAKILESIEGVYNT